MAGKLWQWGWQRIRDLGCNRVLHGLHMSPVTHLEIEKRNQEIEHGPCIARRVTKAYFWVRRWDFATWCQARQQICRAQGDLPPEGPSLVFPKKAWHTQGDHCSRLRRHPLSVASLLSVQQTHRGLENTSSSLRDAAALPILKTSFLDVSTIQGSLAVTWFKSVVLNQGNLASQGTAGNAWGRFWSPWQGSREM